LDNKRPTEQGRQSLRAISKLIGVAPLARDSGTMRGKRTCSHPAVHNRFNGNDAV